MRPDTADRTDTATRPGGADGAAGAAGSRAPGRPGGSAGAERHGGRGLDGTAPAGAPTAVDGLDADGRRRLRRAWWVGAAPVLLLYAWIVTAGTFGPFQRAYFDDFYDAQARALFDGRLDVPRDVVQFEGFLIDGRTYIYFGPVPALLRTPILLVTDRFDGRLTAASMSAAMVVLAIAAFRLTCVLRAAVRDGAPVGRREPVATALLAVAALAAPPLFLASSAVVYHEAVMWGVALAVAGFDAVARWQREPTRRRLVVASALITAAVLSRQSVGFGPLVALGLSAVVALARQWRAAPRPPVPALARRAAALGLACLVPAAAVVGLNYAKFGTLLTPPSDRHIQSLLHPGRQQVLAEHGGSLFALDFAPTTLKQYLRPDGIDIRRDFPWIDFPRLGPSLVGDTTFDELTWSSSLPASAPALTAGALAAAVWAWRTRRRRAGPAAWRLAALTLGAAAGSAGIVAVGYVANRYLNDAYPVVLVPGLVGFHAAVAAAPRWRARRRRLTAAAGVAALGLVGLGLAGNTALALSYQRERGPVVPESWRAQWVDWRMSLPGAYRPYLLPERWVWLPGIAFDGRLAIVGDCDGMYVRVGDQWLGVERGPRVGVHELRVDLDRLPTGGRYPLVTLGADERMTIVAIERLDEERVRVDVSDPPIASGPSRGWNLGDPVELSGEVTIRVEADARVAPSMVLHGRRVLNGSPLATGRALPRYGRAPAGYGVDTAYPGGVELAPFEPDVCREALARGGIEVVGPGAER
ncbi:MAG TPA: hypothetical protein VIL48_18530 [Acidimicrobiales bacterium]